VVFERCTQQVRIAGTEVVAVPLFRVLDGSRAEDYVQRVEPSVRGGERMAAAFADEIERG